MNFEQLQKTLSPSGGTLHLQASSIDDDTFKVPFQRVWGNASIEIQPQNIKTEQNSISFEGSATLPGIKSQESDSGLITLVSTKASVKAYFSLSDTVVEAILDFAITLPLSTLFPLLPYAFAAEPLEEGEKLSPDAPKDQPSVLWEEDLKQIRLVFSTSKRHFKTHDADQSSDSIPLESGLNLVASWTPSAKLTLVSNRSPRLLWGPIVFQRGHDATRPSDTKPWESKELPPGIHMQAALAGQVDFPAGATFEPTHFRIYTPLTYEWVPNHCNLAPIMAYVGGLKFKGKGDELNGNGVITAETWSDFDTDTQIECTFSKLPLTSLNKLWGAPSLSLPEGLSKLDQLQLEQAIVHLTKQPNQTKHDIKGIAFTIGLGRLASWPIVKGKIDVALDEIRVFIEDPMGANQRVSGLLCGSVSTLGAKTLTASIGLPRFNLEARLSEPLELNFNAISSPGSLLEGFPKLNLDPIKIEHLTLNLNPNPLDYRFLIDTSNEKTVLGEGINVSFSTAFEVTNTWWKLAGVAVGDDSGIPIGHMLSHLAGKLESFPSNVKLPEVIDSFKIITFEVTATKASLYTFACTGQIEVDGNSIQGGVILKFDSKEKDYKGWLSIGSRMFSFSADTHAANGNIPSFSTLVAAYQHWGGEALGLGELMGSLISKETSINLDVFQVDLKDAFFATSKSATASNYLFGVDLGAKMEFRSLPIVGQYFTENIGLNNLQIIYAKDTFTAEEVGRFDLPQPVAKKNSSGTARVNTQPTVKSPVALNKGINIAADLDLGFGAQPLTFPTSARTNLLPGTGAAIPPQTTTTDNATWVQIQKSVGPIHFERVGVEYREEKVWALLDASMTAAGLSISLDGLSIGFSPSSASSIACDLRGLGLDYRNGFVEIGGAFLKIPPKKPDDSPEYAGAALIKAQGFTIGAIGSYTTIKDESSLFIYGFLDAIIGGPPCFFVTGLAAGFGYNRNILAPPIEQIAQFPLIAAAQSKSLATEMLPILRNARNTFPPMAGEHFLAAGIMFSSFKLIESSVLLTVAFGKQLEMHVFGLSTLRVPPAELSGGLPAVAEVELAVKGSFIPAEGFLELRAQLTPRSYLLSRDCHLTGGFAFLCWFKPAEGDSTREAKDGDFVLTLGGYHPAFHVPSHYPRVPRLGFNWQLQEWGIALYGDVYFALTPSAVMAGGHLIATWQSRSIMAWFKAGIDFLIAWKPYHYDAEAYIDIGVQVTFEFFGTQRLSLDVGADLHIWGPEFAGEATVHLWIISFTIDFGNTEASKVKPIEWSEFKTSFLPEPDKICSISVTDGLVRKGKDSVPNDLGTLNGKHFCLTTESRIPLTQNPFSTENAVTSFGLAPVGVSKIGASTFELKILRTVPDPNSKDNDVTSNFSYTAIKKNVPAALWGASVTPQLHGPQFVEDALCGFQINAKAPNPSTGTATILRKELLINIDLAPQSCLWEASLSAFKADATKSVADLLKDIDSKAATNRNELLDSLRLKFDDLTDNAIPYDFLAPPQCEVASTAATGVTP